MAQEQKSVWNKYTLFHGLTHNSCGYFASCVVFFRAPQGRAGKNTSNKQNVRWYYMLNNRIKGLLLHYKRNVILQLASIFFFFRVRVLIQKHSVRENDVHYEQNVRAYYIPNHRIRGQIILLPRKESFWLLFLFHFRPPIRPVQP